MSYDPATARPDAPLDGRWWLALVILGGLVVAGSAAAIAEWWRAWQRPHAVFGYVAIGLAVGVLAWRRPEFVRPRTRQRWWGVLLLAAVLAAAVAFRFATMPLAELYTLPVALVAAAVVCGGATMARWAARGAAIAACVLPLPWALENALVDPLHTFSAHGAAFVLQTLGREAYQQGGRLVSGEEGRALADATSRLPALGLACAITTAAAFLRRRSWREWLLMALTGILLAVVANVVRLVVAGWRPPAEGVTPALAGPAGVWLMLPMIVALTAGEWYLLNHLFYDESEAQRPRDVWDETPRGGRS